MNEIRESVETALEQGIRAREFILGPGGVGLLRQREAARSTQLPEGAVREVQDPSIPRSTNWLGTGHSSRVCPGTQDSKGRRASMVGLRRRPPGDRGDMWKTRPFCSSLPGPLAGEVAGRGAGNAESPTNSIFGALTCSGHASRRSARTAFTASGIQRRTSTPTTTVGQSSTRRRRALRSRPGGWLRPLLGEATRLAEGRRRRTRSVDP